MNIKARRLHEMLVRVNRFGARHAKQFPAGTMGGRLFASVRDSVREASRYAAAQRSGRGEAPEATTKATARNALRGQLEAIRRTARAVALDVPGFDVDFRIPRGNSDTRLLMASRSIAQHARERASEFVAYGLPQSFLVDLAVSTDGFEQAIREGVASRVNRLSGYHSLKASLDSGLVAVRRLDAVVPNLLSNEPTTLASWRSARRVSRRPFSRRRVERAKPLPINESPAVTDASVTDN